MTRRLAVVVALLCFCAAAPATAKPPVFTPGAPGLGDEYFPLDGNGGYDVSHYDLDLAYDAASDRLTGVATIQARATQNLSSFNLDLDGLTVRVGRGRRAAAPGAAPRRRADHRAREGLRRNERFTVRIAYDGVPETRPTISGFLHTDDGALAVGQPHGASSWFPVNDYLTDKASYTIAITTPQGIEAIANGRLAKRSTRGRHTPGRGGPRADGLLPRDARDRRLRRPRLPRGRNLLLGRRRPATCSRPVAPRTGDAYASRSPPTSPTSGCADDQRSRPPAAS